MSEADEKTKQFKTGDVVELPSGIKAEVVGFEWVAGEIIRECKWLYDERIHRTWHRDEELKAVVK